MKKLILALFFFSTQAFAAGSYCGKMQLSRGTLNYCVRLSPIANPTRVVYFLHGLGQDARAIFSSELNSGIDTLDQSTGADAPTIVGLDTGAAAVIPFASAVARDLVREAMPKIEREAGIDSSSVRRHLIGASLGGYNALNFAASFPREFRSVSALCPALIDFDPFVSKQVDDYIYRNQTRINAQKVAYMVNQLRRDYRSERNWSKTDPISLAKRGAFNGMQLFVSVGEQDEYGFFEGAKAFSDAVHAYHSARLNYSQVPGGHCSFDVQRLLNFLTAELER